METKPYWVQIELEQQADITGFRQLDLSRVSNAMFTCKNIDGDKHSIMMVDFTYNMNERIGMSGIAAKSFHEKWSKYLQTVSPIKHADPRNEPSSIIQAVMLHQNAQITPIG